MGVTGLTYSAIKTAPEIFDRLLPRIRVKRNIYILELPMGALILETTNMSGMMLEVTNVFCLMKL